MTQKNDKKPFYGVNGHIALERLIDGNPYTLEEILEIGKNNAKKSEKFDWFCSYSRGILLVGSE